MKYSRLTKKHQATIPKDICSFLDVDSGDMISLSLDKDKVVIKKTAALDAEYLRSLEGPLSAEWLSEEDSKAFDDLSYW